MNETKPRIFGKLAALSLILIACAGLFSCASDDGGSVTETPSGYMPRQLPYGISISMPEDWQVIRAADPSVVTKGQLDSQVAKDEKVVLLEMKRLANNELGMDGTLAVVLLNASKNFPPEAEMRSITQEQLDQIAQNFLRNDQQAAARQNQQSPLISVRVTKTEISGYMALVRRLRGKGKTGEVTALEWYVYLPGGTGMLIRGTGELTSPGIETIFERIANSVKVQP